MNENKFSLKNVIAGLLFVIILFALVRFVKLFIHHIGNVINMLSSMDVVVIVALITGSVSILSVVISSIVSKIIEYKQTIKKYLYEKKEEPYSEFIEMVYKIQENTKKNKKYKDEGMLDDI